LRSSTCGLRCSRTPLFGVWVRPQFFVPFFRAALAAKLPKRLANKFAAVFRLPSHRSQIPGVRSLRRLPCAPRPAVCGAHARLFSVPCAPRLRPPVLTHAAFRRLGPALFGIFQARF